MKKQRNDTAPHVPTASGETDQKRGNDQTNHEEKAPQTVDNVSQIDTNSPVSNNKPRKRPTRRQRDEMRQGQRRRAVVQNVQLRAFRRSLTRWTFFYALFAVLIAEAAVTLGVMILEMNLTSTNLFVETLDFMVTFRLLPMLCQFALWGVVAYAVVKLGTRGARLQITVLFVQSVLLFLLRAAEELLAGAAMYDVAFNFALLREFGSYMMQNVGYWILGLIAFLIPAFVLVFLCIYLAQEYQGAKRSARLQKNTDQAVKAKKNPMPSICLWTAVSQTLLAIAEILPQSITTFQNNGSFFADAGEFFSYFIPYLALLCVGVAGYFIMLGVTKQFGHVLHRIRQRYPLPQENIVPPVEK